MNKKDTQAWMKGFKNFKEVLLELCFPTTCILCGELDKYSLCKRCEKKNPLVKEPRCMCCGKPISKNEEEYCNDCLINKKIFTQGKNLWVHKEDIKLSIYKFKYKNKRIFAKKYAELLVEEYGNLLTTWKPDCIVPVPVHKHRKRKRGYNQATVLSYAISEKICEEYNVNLVVDESLLKRKKETIFQKKLDNKQRKRNITGAFILEKQVMLPKTVLLVDDIYTTGATLQEISKVLVLAGVENVFFLTISIGQGF